MSRCSRCDGTGTVTIKDTTYHPYGDTYAAEDTSYHDPCSACEGRGYDEDGPDDSIAGVLMHPVKASDGTVYPKGTKVFTFDGDGDAEELMKQLLFDDPCATWLLPNGEERTLEPDMVDFGFGV